MSQTPQSERPAALDPAAACRRAAWKAARLEMEAKAFRSGRRGARIRELCRPERLATEFLKCFLKLTGLYGRGLRNARRIRLRELDLVLPKLPPAFDGFTILHLSDLHVDRMPGLAELALSAWDGREVDLCILTGDYRDRTSTPDAVVTAGLRALLGGIRSRQGFLGVLGNHDGCGIVAPMESMGVRMLTNEGVRLPQGTVGRAGGQDLRIIGIDDVHTFHTAQADRVLEQARDGFCIALVHSPELYDVAWRKGVDLYLCGHTHGGQVCLPGGWAITCNLHRGWSYHKGTWNYRGMVGVTHHGTGTANLPVRYNMPGELLVLRLRRRTR